MYLYLVSNGTCTTFIKQLPDRSQVQTNQTQKWLKYPTTHFNHLLVISLRRSTLRQQELSFHMQSIAWKNCPYVFWKLGGIQDSVVVLHLLLKGSALLCIRYCVTLSICGEPMKYWYNWWATSPLNLLNVFDGHFTPIQLFMETTKRYYGHDFLDNGQLRSRVEHGRHSQQQFSLNLTFIIIVHPRHTNTTLWATKSARLEEATMIQH